MMPPPPPRLPSKPAWLPPVSAPVILPPPPQLQPQPPVAAPTARPPQSVAAWLAAAGLGHMQGALIDNGYDALDVVAEMHDKDMNACGIYDTGDRAALALAIQRLRASRPS